MNRYVSYFLLKFATYKKFRLGKHALNNVTKRKKQFVLIFVNSFSFAKEKHFKMYQHMKAVIFWKNMRKALEEFAVKP